MAFIQSVIKNPTRSLREVAKGSAVAMTKGFAVTRTAGLAVNAAAATPRDQVVGICNQDILAAEALVSVPVIDIFDGDIWIADSTSNSNAAHNGQLMIFGANAGVVNNTGTTSAVGVVQQEGVYGAAADRKILVRFI